MPVDIDGAQAASTQVDVLPSAVMELTYLLWQLPGGSKWSPEMPGLQTFKAESARLSEQLHSIWPDGDVCLVETSILADRIDALLTDEAETFLSGLERAVLTDRDNLEMRSEKEYKRTGTLKRLERLRREPRLRRRYATLLARVWELARPEWEATGRGTVERCRRDWTDRLSRGTAPLDLLDSRHIVRKPDHAALLEIRPRLVISPIYFSVGGGFIIDMTTFIHVGRPARDLVTDELRRRDSELTADRLKVLADGTRLAILRLLTREPASVTDLARRFRLAQPTVSNHVRLLRDAGLLESQRDGARVVYTASGDRLSQLLRTAEALLLDH